MSQNGEQLARVNQDTRLNNRVLDLRTPANQAIFLLRCSVLDVRHRFFITTASVNSYCPFTDCYLYEIACILIAFKFTDFPYTFSLFSNIL